MNHPKPFIYGRVIRPCSGPAMRPIGRIRPTTRERLARIRFAARHTNPSNLVASGFLLGSCVTWIFHGILMLFLKH